MKNRSHKFVHERVKLNLSRQQSERLQDLVAAEQLTTPGRSRQDILRDLLHRGLDEFEAKIAVQRFRHERKA